MQMARGETFGPLQGGTVRPACVGVAEHALHLLGRGRANGVESDCLKTS